MTYITKDSPFEINNFNRILHLSSEFGEFTRNPIAELLLG